MTDSVNRNELLARYIVFSKWYRKNDNTVKPEAFIPHNSTELSVTIHFNYTESAIWNIGKQIADSISLNLHGRADVKAGIVFDQNLQIQQAPVEGNSNHANIVKLSIGLPTRVLKRCVL